MLWKREALAKSLNETERPLIVSVSLSMAFASEVNRAERQLTFEANLKDTKVSDISIWHQQANSFPKG